jgi:hypothetical protein
MRQLLRRLEEAAGKGPKVDDLRASVETREKNSRIKRDNAEDECFLCGRGITAKTLPKCWWIHMRTDGFLLTQDDDDPKSQGMFVVGPECAKKVPLPYRFRLED